MRVETESKRNSEQQIGQTYYYHCDEYWEANGHCTYYGGNCCAHNECSLKKDIKNIKYTVVVKIRDSGLSYFTYGRPMGVMSI